MVPSFPPILPFPLGAAGSHESAFHFCRFASVLEISCKWIPATCGLSSPAFLAQRGVSGFSRAVAVDQYLPAFSQLNNIPLWICSLWLPHPVVKERVCCFCFLAVAGRATVNVLIPAHVWTCVFPLAWMCMPASGIAGSYAESLLTS